MSTYSYAASKGRREVNWAELVYLPTSQKDEWKLLTFKVSNWSTCAVGCLDYRIPRDARGIPHDTQLEELGRRFAKIILTLEDMARNGEWVGMVIYQQSAIQVLASMKHRETELTAHFSEY